jgi:hypothetical protein
MYGTFLAESRYEMASLRSAARGQTLDEFIDAVEADEYSCFYG